MGVLSIEQLREKIRIGEAKDPLVYLESVMCGQDPNSLSPIYQLAMEIEEFSDDAIHRSDWEELLNLIIDSVKYRKVSHSESSSAAKTLAEYLHPKRKHIDITEPGAGGLNTQNLEAEEIELFSEKFHAEF